ncbi:hypothetical protein N7456_006431 [Penicillium angulare]|uniref:FAD dependent oxidoreductase domain-containing protein n=1 Tax=Penicillium angulare TaxID=116970 RepID=A0A9W9KBP1_9EURO|nr:hypothetical protein N7456_006431 [Penicillium angulare]
MASKDQKDQSILILGAGCFGLATAYHLASNGYRNITVLEKDSEVPSRFSAANDLNKVIRAEYADPFYTTLALDAIKKWQTDPLYSPHYHQTGFLNVTSNAAPAQTKQVIAKYFASIKDHPSFVGQVERMNGQNDIKKLVPAFNGPVEGWSGYFNSLAGYGHSADTLKTIHEACLSIGVKFYLGEADGEVESLVHTSARHATICVGAKTRGGKIHLADKIILALGAGVANLIPRIGKQMTGRCWGVAHIQLTPTEASQFRGIPVTNVRDLAFFFEPDHETNKLKFCHMGGAFTNYSWSKDGLSLPFNNLSDSNFIPANDEVYIRQLLKQVLPQFADRPLIDKHLCWFADTDDSDYIIDFVPGMGGSLLVLSGDSGHGFKMMPIFGSFVEKLLTEGKQSQPKWQWKDTKPKQASVWRSGESQELAGVPRSKL